MNQIELHNEIDRIIKAGPETAEVANLNNLLGLSFDSRLYFFTKVDDRWLDFIRVNGFLSVLNETSSDVTKYTYKIPELDFLVRAAKSKPGEVVDIIMTVEISEGHFNPEVLDRFLWIASQLPAPALKKLSKKILKEDWPRLMVRYSRWGFDYAQMLKTLWEAREYQSVLEIGESLLTIKTKAEMKVDAFGGVSDNPFCLADLQETKIFEYLAFGEGQEYAEKSLALATNAMKNIVLLGNKTTKGSVFAIDDVFYLFDVDFYSLHVGEKEFLSHRDDVRDLAATIKELSERIIGKPDAEIESIKNIYKKYIESLPDSRSMWRLKLFVLGLRQDVFKDILEETFFRIFKHNESSDLIYGAEYEKTLKKCFGVLDETDREKYIEQAFVYFSDLDKKEWYKVYGLQIFSSIFSFLTQPQKDKATKLFGELNSDFDPQPSIGHSRTGFINPQSPVSISNLSIAKIIELLKSDLSPENLAKKKDSDDFFNPKNAEGVGAEIRNDISKRPQEYVDNALLFFDRDLIDPNYTYSLLFGLWNAIRENKVGPIKWDGIINLLKVIAVSFGERRPTDKDFEREKGGGWLATWSSVEKSMSDLINELLSERGVPIPIEFKKYRGDLLYVISYLLKCAHPYPSSDKEDGSSPFDVAINSTRGRAFQAFTLFVYEDGKQFAKNAKIKITSDLKKIYEDLLTRENTRSVWFTIGHYLPSFYYRDRDWIDGLMPVIFTADPAKKDFYLAAWEGYISTNLYGDIFSNPLFQDLYSRAIALEPSEYTKRKYTKELDEGLATHLALAFVHFDFFTVESFLFKEFWAKKVTKRHEEFVSFIGRHAISRDRPSEWIKQNKIDIEKIKKLWDWILTECREKEVLASFGFWISLERDVFDATWLADHILQTVKITNGVIGWEYGLMKSLPTLGEEAPLQTLAIIKTYLFGEKTQAQQREWLYVDSELLSTFKILYANPKTKEDTYSLIDTLLPLANGRFWVLKTVIDEDLV